MSGRPAYERESYQEDIKALLARGFTADQAARRLGISRATLYRILQGTQQGAKRA